MNKTKSKNNYFIFASDKRSYLDTINVVKELKERNLPYFYFFCKEQFPLRDLSNFSWETNVDQNNSSLVSCDMLQCNLPFKPNVVILTRESWEPQLSVIKEFKQWGCIISCIENAVWIVGTIKSRMEMISRYRYPTNCIDIFFENSSWSLETKNICGWYDFKSTIVGNPKYDNLDLKTYDEDSILVFGTMEDKAKMKVNSILEKLITTNKKIYYRPHPGEITSNAWEPNMNMGGITIVEDESDIPEIASKCNFHLANIGASAYYSVLFNKTFVSIDQNIRVDDFDINFFKGKEYDFWAPILGVNSWDEFVDKIDMNIVERLKQRFKETKENILMYDNELEFLKINKKPISNKFFDDFNDKKASIRIINHLEQL